MRRSWILDFYVQGSIAILCTWFTIFALRITWFSFINTACIRRRKSTTSLEIRSTVNFDFKHWCQYKLHWREWYLSGCFMKTVIHCSNFLFKSDMEPNFWRLLFARQDFPFKQLVLPINWFWSIHWISNRSISTRWSRINFTISVLDQMANLFFFRCFTSNSFRHPFRSWNWFSSIRRNYHFKYRFMLSMTVLVDDWKIATSTKSNPD